MRRRPLVFAFVIASLASCGRSAEKAPPPYTGEGENILLIIADDLGLEQTSAYGHPAAVPTPTLDALAARGVRFDNAYTYTYCSPTRAALLTGRVARRTGVGKIVDGEDHALSRRAPSVARIVEKHGLATSAVGKWHMAKKGDFDHPNAMGFSWYAGSMSNPTMHTDKVKGKTGYYRWEKIINGVSKLHKKYMTTDTVDDALARIETMPEPWFLWLAFNAPHYPQHVPPAHLHRLPGIVETPERPSYQFRAMAQAMDTELGRLFDSIDPAVLARTNIIFLSDNGSPAYYAYPPHRHDRSKGQVYDGGIHVPFIVAGPIVKNPGTRTSVYVHALDVLPTIAELVGADLKQEKRNGKRVNFDGRSFLPWVRAPDLENDRRYLFGEHFESNGRGPYSRDDRTVRDDRYRLVRRMGDRTPPKPEEDDENEGRQGKKEMSVDATSDGGVKAVVMQAVSVEEPQREIIDEFFEIPDPFDEDGNLLPTGLDEGPNLLPELTPRQRKAYRRLSAALDRYFEVRPYQGW